MKKIEKNSSFFFFHSFDEWCFFDVEDEEKILHFSLWFFCCLLGLFFFWANNPSIRINQILYRISFFFSLNGEFQFWWFFFLIVFLNFHKVQWKKSWHFFQLVVNNNNNNRSNEEKKSQISIDNRLSNDWPMATCLTCCCCCCCCIILFWNSFEILLHFLVC